MHTKNTKQKQCNKSSWKKRSQNGEEKTTTKNNADTTCTDTDNTELQIALKIWGVGCIHIPTHQGESHMYNRNSELHPKMLPVCSYMKDVYSILCLSVFYIIKVHFTHLFSIFYTIRGFHSGFLPFSMISPDVTPSPWLGSEHQQTNKQTNSFLWSAVYSTISIPITPRWENISLKHLPFCFHYGRSSFCSPLSTKLIQHQLGYRQNCAPLKGTVVLSVSSLFRIGWGIDKTVLLWKVLFWSSCLYIWACMHTHMYIPSYHTNLVKKLFSKPSWVYTTKEQVTGTV